MRIVFVGSGEFGLPTLQHLHGLHDVAAVVSQPDRPAGRKRQPTPTPIAQWSQQAGIEMLKSDDVNDASFVQQVDGLGADAAIVIAFGQKLSESLIGALGRLVVNLHASLLPRYRGAAPINWAIINGETATGLSIISLAQRMDAGVSFGQTVKAIDPQETAGELHDQLAQMGPSLVERVLGEFQSGTLKGIPQDESKVSRAPKLTKADGWVNFDATADEVRCRVHGLTPWPGVAVVWWRKGEEKGRSLWLRRVEAHPGSPVDQTTGTVLNDQHVAVRDGTIRLLEVQLPGGRVMPIDQFIHGHQLESGDVLRRELSDDAASGLNHCSHVGDR